MSEAALYHGQKVPRFRRCKHFRSLVRVLGDRKAANALFYIRAFKKWVLQITALMMCGGLFLLFMARCQNDVLFCGQTDMIYRKPS